MGKIKLHPAAKLQRAETGLQEIQKEYNGRLTRVLSYKATDKDTFEKGGELLKVVSEATKKAKAEKAKTLDPAELTVKRIKEQWKPFEDALKAATGHIKLCMDAWLKAETARIAAEKAKILTDSRITKPETVERKLNGLSFAMPTGNTRNVLEMVITNEALIPREYLMVDEVKLRAALKEGVVVPGAEMVRQKKIVVR